MANCSQHSEPQISCENCFTSEELEARIAELNQFKIPAAPGSKSKPKRADAGEGKKKRSSWMDDLIGE